MVDVSMAEVISYVLKAEDRQESANAVDQLLLAHERAEAMAVAAERLLVQLGMDALSCGMEDLIEADWLSDAVKMWRKV